MLRLGDTLSFHVLAVLDNKTYDEQYGPRESRHRRDKPLGCNFHLDLVAIDNDPKPTCGSIVIFRRASCFARITWTRRFSIHCCCCNWSYSIAVE